MSSVSAWGNISVLVGFGPTMRLDESKPVTCAPEKNSNRLYLLRRMLQYIHGSSIGTCRAFPRDGIGLGPGTEFLFGRRYGMPTTPRLSTISSLLKFVNGGDLTKVQPQR